MTEDVGLPSGVLVVHRDGLQEVARVAGVVGIHIIRARGRGAVVELDLREKPDRIVRILGDLAAVVVDGLQPAVAVVVVGRGVHGRADAVLDPDFLLLTQRVVVIPQTDPGDRPGRRLVGLEPPERVVGIRDVFAVAIHVGDEITRTMLSMFGRHQLRVWSCTRMCWTHGSVGHHVGLMGLYALSCWD